MVADPISLLIKVIHMEMIGGLERWLKNLALSKPYGEWGDQRMVADPISLTPFLSSFLTGSGETNKWWLTPFLLSKPYGEWGDQ